MAALDDLKTVVSAVVTHASDLQNQLAAVKAALVAEQASHTQTRNALDAANEELVANRDAMVAMKEQLALIVGA